MAAGPATRPSGPNLMACNKRRETGIRTAQYTHTLLVQMRFLPSHTGSFCSLLLPCHSPIDRSHLNCMRDGRRKVAGRRESGDEARKE